eukprot:SAG22_NODE_1454_length_4388_cov_65.736302_1_plen_80_part_10
MNGRPHWSTAAGWHLYYFPEYNMWFLSGFSPEEDLRNASILAAESGEEQRERHHGIELGSAGHSRVGSMGGETPLPAPLP